MSVRFVIGRAGAGKTAHCLNAVARSLDASPLAGPGEILLVPEQASLQMERALLERTGTGVIHRARVLSFRRLADRVLDACGDGGKSALTPAGRTMIVRRLLGELRSSLRYYRRIHQSHGLAGRIGQTIAELIDEAVRPADLIVPDAGETDDPILPHKLHDLRMIYDAYLDALGESRIDPAHHLELTRARMAGCAWLNGCAVYVDGFAGFTRQERITLVALAGMAGSMDVTVLIDPQAAEGGGSASVRLLFDRARRTLSGLAEAFKEAGLEIDRPLVLEATAERLAECHELALLERHLFQSPPSTVPATPTAVRLVAASDRRTEVEYAVATVLDWVSRSHRPLRYRDIALIVRDLEPYHDLLTAALRSRGIPFFLDRRRSITHHPLIGLVRSLIDVAHDDLSPRAVRSLLKTGFVELDDDEADALDNFLLATNLGGLDWWSQTEDWLAPAKQRGDPLPAGVIARMEQINDVRRRLLDQLQRWIVTAQEGPRPGHEWVGLIRQALGDLSVESHIEDWARSAHDDGDLDLAESHRQTWRDVCGVIDDLDESSGDETLDLETLGRVLDSAFAQITLGIAPPMLDEVLVSSIDRSRHPDIKSAVVLGANDGLFPSIPPEPAILHDDDRRWLQDHGVSLGTPRRQRLLDEAMLFYIAATRPGEALVVTYALSDEQGRPLRPSPFVDELRALWPTLNIECVSNPLPSRDDWDIATDVDLAVHLAHEFRHRPPPGDDDAGVREAWNAIYDRARRDESLDSTLRSSLASLAYDNAASLTPAAVARAVRDPFRASVTQLETHAACPFKHFASYRLRLEERARAELEAVDIGTVHHAIFEHFVKTLTERGESLADLDDAVLARRLDESCRYVGETLPMAGEAVQPRDRYLMSRNAELLGRVLSAQRAAARIGRFKPHSAELGFGMDDEKLPGLAVMTPAGRRLLLRGFIDRVDLAEAADEMLGVVIDYKLTRDKRLDLSRVYHGLSLQLLGYLLLLAQRGQTLAGRSIKPAGAFYVPLTGGYRLVADPEDVDEGGRLSNAHRPRGLIDVDALEALDDQIATGWSSVYSVFQTKTGELGNVDRSDAADGRAFGALLEHVTRRMGEIADAILDGDIRVNPYRLGSFRPCSWCAFGGVCRFESRFSNMRFLESLRRSEVFQRLAAAPPEHGP